MVSHAAETEKATIVIMGASGDLTARKLMPAMFELSRGGFLHEGTRILGVARREKSTEAFREEMQAAVAEHGARPATAGDLTDFVRRLEWCQVDLLQPADYAKLAERIEAGRDPDRPTLTMIYMATSQSLFEPCIRSLADAGFADAIRERDFRVVAEPQFGGPCADYGRRVDRDGRRAWCVLRLNGSSARRPAESPLAAALSGCHGTSCAVPGTRSETRK